MSTNNISEQFSLIYKENAQSITRLCYLYLGDSDLAQDAAQETFIKAYRKLSSFKGNSSLNTWLTAIAINTCKSLMRSKHYRNTVSLDEAIGVPASLADKEVNLSISEAVQSLPESFRTVILLKYYRELKADEIAKMLKVPVTTVNYRLSKAKELLKELLKEDFDYD
ncbi:MAG: sigma-70 family RNA polymerase sigma factor [Ruminococcus sp.]|nr:sigma-70 family RNA polymerase sigma factor [Ruminococcus sp.]